MSIGIIGSGAIGSNLARAFARKDIPAMISNRRGPASLAPLIEEIGPAIKAVNTREAAAADIVIVAVRWVDLRRALSGLPAWNGRIVIDSTNPVVFLDPGSPDAKDSSNPLAAYGIRAIDLEGRYSTQVFRELVPGARVVKALNHLPAEALAQPEASGGKRVQFYAGDDAGAKAEVRKLLEWAGYFAVDIGPLDVGGRLSNLPDGPLMAADFIKI